jgi:hypothetical protein
MPMNPLRTKQGLPLPIWPEGLRVGAAAHFDKARAEIEKVLNDLLDRTAKDAADRHRTDEYFSDERKPRVDAVREQLAQFRKMPANVRDIVLPGIVAKILAEAPTVSDSLQGEIRNSIATNPKRAEVIEGQIVDGDVATLVALANTPAVRNDVVSSPQRERAREALIQRVNPRDAERMATLRELVPVFEQTVAFADRYVADMQQASRQDVLAMARVRDNNIGAIAAVASFLEGRNPEARDDKPATPPKVEPSAPAVPPLTAEQIAHDERIADEAEIEA